MIDDETIIEKMKEPRQTEYFKIPQTQLISEKSSFTQS